MIQRQIALPRYSPDKFVDREEELGFVLEKARPLTEGSIPNIRTVIFAGERGTGKSWLLAHLHAKLLALPGLFVFLLSLGEYADWDPTLSMVDILRRLSTTTGGRREGLGATPADMSRNLMHDIRQLLDKQVLVLLVDQVYESDWKLLAALEDYLLGPLAVEPRVLIVMAGRGRAYPWKTPELRLKAQFVDLPPFQSVTVTAGQLERQHKKAVPKAREIHNLSGGNPLANYLVAICDNPGMALGQVVDGMLETVPAERRRQVREYLEALCVLRSFDEERIPVMLAAYYDDDTYREWSYAQARSVREELVKWAFARWDAEQGGYVLDELTRKLLEHYLEIAERERWGRLQRAASELYGGWARDYPRTRDRWRQEVQYHIHRLQNIHSSHTSAATSL